MIDIDLVALDATSLGDLVRTRQLSATGLVQATLGRIDELDRRIDAFRVVMAEEAMAEAVRLDELTDEELRSLPLAGVPVAIKDDTDVANQVTAWGSAVNRGVCERNAEVVARLRAAGAVIVGKTNVPELTLWPWTASSRWGTTANPWNLERTPGGSSGGSAAAVATGMCALALGSDGGGSVRYPAGLTGVVGLKPQRDRIPLGSEHGSGWHGLVVLGPLARSVRDAALFLDVASGGAGAPGSTADIGKLRIAVSVEPPPGTGVALSAAGRAAVDAAVAILTAEGHEISEIEVDYPRAALWSSTVRLLKGVQADVAGLPDRIALERRTRAVARLGSMLPGRVLRNALADEQSISASINSVFDHADVVLTPLCASPAPRLDDCPSSGAIRSLKAANTSAWLVPWNLTGQPAIAVPVGLDDDGLPTAVQLVGRPHDERTLLSLAAQIEHGRPPLRWSPTEVGL